MNNQEIKSNKSGGGEWGNHKIKLKRYLSFSEKVMMEKIRDSF